MSKIAANIDYILRHLGRKVIDEEFIKDAPTLGAMTKIGGFTSSHFVHGGNTYRRGKGLGIVTLDAADIEAWTPRELIDTVLGSVGLVARCLGKAIEDAITGKTVGRQDGFVTALNEAHKIGFGVGITGFRQADPGDVFRYLGPGVPHVVNDDGLAILGRRYEDCDSWEIRIRAWGNPTPPTAQPASGDYAGVWP